jgi:transposase
VKIKNLQYDYSKNGGYIQLCMPIETEQFIPVDDSVRLLDQVLEGLDYSKLYLAYSPKGRNPAVKPKTLFKIIVYAYSQGIYASRKIEQACRRDLCFIWLRKGEPAPDHNTISRFRKTYLPGCIENLLTQMVMQLANCGEIEYENLFVDGTKLEANANCYTFVWKKVVEKNEAKLQAKLQEYFAQELKIKSVAKIISAQDIREQLVLLKKAAKQQRVEFVHGKGKHKTVLQRQIDQLEEYLERQVKYDSYNGLFGDRNSFSKTDSDATFMRMKNDHMQNGQLKPGYNIQIGVESEYIVGAMVSSERSDMGTLIPFMQQLEQNYGRKFQNLVADAGYESEENYAYLEQQDIVAYIKPSNHEYSKTRKFQREQAFRLAMIYDRETDSYTCKNGRKLSYRYDIVRKSKRGYENKSRVYTCDSCEGCPHLGMCYKGKYAKKIQLAVQFEQYREQSRCNILSEQGIRLRINRSIQAEGVFGILKQDFGFRRFLTRGTVNVQTELMLLALGFNVNKLHNRIQYGRVGQSLFQSKQVA